MPGVPTSKGCNECRKRKKGCDLVQPICGRCTKLGLKCINNGAGRLKFVDLSENLAQRRKTNHGKSPGSDRAPSRSSKSSSPELPTSEFQIAPLQRTAIINHATGAFWLAYTPITHESAHQSGPYRVAGWLHVALQASQGNKGLNDAVTALALSRMSRQTGDRRARREALRFYGSCVQQVRKAITSSDCIHDDSLLATVMLLATFEIHEGTHRRDTAWGAHVDGASKLINARGATSIQTSFGRSLYLGHLRDELIYAISTRGRSRKGIDKTTYFAFDPGDDENLDVQLLRILSTMPTIMEESDRLRTVTNHILLESGMSAFLLLCATTMNALQDFCLVLEAAAAPNPLYIELPSPLYATLPFGSPERIFSEYLHFPSFSLASLQLTVWTSILLLQSTLFLTWEHVRIHHASFPVDSLVPIADLVPTHNPEYVDNLALTTAQALEYFILPENGLLGAHQVGYTIPVVMGYMAYWKWPEQMWFKVLFKRMKELNLGVEGFLADMFQNQVLKLIKPLDHEGDLLDSTGMKRWNGNVFTSVTARYKSTEDEEIVLGVKEDEGLGEWRDVKQV